AWRSNAASGSRNTMMGARQRLAPARRPVVLVYSEVHVTRFVLDRPHESFRVGILIRRTLGRQHNADAGVPKAPPHDVTPEGCENSIQLMPHADTHVAAPQDGHSVLHRWMRPTVRARAGHSVARGSSCGALDGRCNDQSRRSVRARDAARSRPVASPNIR